ncbi:MAG: type II toxin-antitoxin system RelE/ParE family toxin [Massilia sp.]
MSFRVRYTRAARDDLRRLQAHLAAHDPALARRARDAISKAVSLLKDFPFTCRKATGHLAFLRELVIPFGGAGYVMLFEIEGAATVTILAVRHQRQDDYF